MAADGAEDGGVSGRVQFVRAGARAAGGQCKVFLNPSAMSSAHLRAGADVAVLLRDGAQLLACGVVWPMDKVPRRGVGLSAMWERAVAAQTEVAVVALAAGPRRAAAVALQAVSPPLRQPAAAERALLERYVLAMLDGVLLHPGALLSLPVHGSSAVLRVLRIDGGARRPTAALAPAATTAAVARVSAASTQLSVDWAGKPPEEAAESAAELGPGPVGEAEAAGEGLAAVGGLQREVRAVREVLEAPLRHPERLRRFGLPAPRGVLLFGPPGTGKTLLARALAAELRAKAFFVSGPEVVSRFVGESEANLRAVFARARRAAPALVFIDEVDALCPRRDARAGDVERRLVATLLTLMDGLATGDGADDRPVVVLAATNRPDALDPAVRRPGRFDREVEVGVPSAAERLDILRVALRRLPLAAADEQLRAVADAAHGYVGADLSAVAKEAALLALRRAAAGEDGRREAFRVEAADLRVAMRGVKPSALRELAVEVPRVRWSDIGGQQALKQQLREAVEWPLRHPEAFARLGVRPPKGVLLYGPPGCSKTLAAKALATESGMNFLAVKGPELLSKWVGDSERAVQQLFRKARAAAPAVVFLDEVDALAAPSGGGGGGGGGAQVADRVLSQLLTELDGAEPLRRVLVVAATNRPDLLAPALLRPGRIDRALFVGPPDLAGREEILAVHTRRLPLAADVRLDALAVATARFSGAELAALCREAAAAAVEEQRAAAQHVSARHFLAALERVRPQIGDAMLAFFDDFRRRQR